MTSNRKKLFSVFARLYEEFKSSQEDCWLEIVRRNGKISINFVHFHESYESNNKWLSIHESNPESSERLKNYIIEVLRKKRLIKKGV
ncbi:hypothetical protein [Mammaliicoccus sciuri]|uniref:hypothetical protein n=1 Tax=Mammaliicoccus sciuri TaxID=1296 RepID=UPI001C4FBC3B|nr:hypothetical protein [Mammaliicoccus sciuri]